jgi:O-antigen ligase
LRKRILLWKYLAAAGIGIGVGFRAIPPVVVGVVYLLLLTYCIVKFLQNDVSALFSILPLAIYNEIIVRGYARWVPYLTMQYVYIIGFTFMLLTRKGKSEHHTKVYIFLLVYTLIEVINGFYPYIPQLLRSTLVQSFSLLMVVVWACNTVLTPAMINKLMDNLKVAAVYLAGIVLVAHLKGDIEYGSASSSDASNDLAPVQLSGYLGTGAVIFFLTLMNKQDKSNKTFQLIAFAFVTIIMVLTFSRGGLYFLVVTVVLYFYYNRAQIGNYFRFIILIPVIMLIYSLVVQQTGGKIVERYEEKGASSREDLVSIGFTLFARNPITGVGTSNYNTEIKKQKLFYVESGAHNEFVRAAAEHGILGIMTYWVFFIALFFEINNRRQPQKQYAIFFLVLFCLITVHNGLKISLQPIILMLAVATPSIMKMQKLVHVTTKKQLRA